MSTGKIAILLAAVQLRDDVRAVQQTGFLSTQDYDQLFAMPQLWNRSRDTRIQRLATPSSAPRISTIFDFAKLDIDFTGPNPDTPDGNAIYNKIAFDVHGNPIVAAHGVQSAEPLPRHWSVGRRSTLYLEALGAPRRRARPPPGTESPPAAG